MAVLGCWGGQMTGWLNCGGTSGNEQQMALLRTFDFDYMWCVTLGHVWKWPFISPNRAKQKWTRQRHASGHFGWIWWIIVPRCRIGLFVYAPPPHWAVPASAGWGRPSVRPTRLGSRVLGYHALERALDRAAELVYHLPTLEHLERRHGRDRVLVRNVLSQEPKQQRSTRSVKSVPIKPQNKAIPSNNLIHAPPFRPHPPSRTQPRRTWRSAPQTRARCPRTAGTTSPKSPRSSVFIHPHNSVIHKVHQFTMSSVPNVPHRTMRQGAAFGEDGDE